MGKKKRGKMKAEITKTNKSIWMLVGMLLIVVMMPFVWGFLGFGEDDADTGADEELYGDLKKGFELDTLFLKTSVEQNSSVVSNIKITNLDEHTEACDVTVLGIDDLVEVSVNNLSVDKIDLNVRGEQDVKITFNSNKPPGIYVGELVFSSPCKTQIVPVILEIESGIVVFDANVNIYPVSEDIVKGDKLNANIKVYDLASIGLHDIEINYVVKGFDGNIVLSESEEMIIEDRLDYTKGFDLPKNLDVGSYVFGVAIEYTDFVGTLSYGTSSVFFDLVEEKLIDEEGGKDTLDSTLIILIIILFGFFFLIFLGLFVYSLFFRDKMLKQIERQYRGELGRQRKLIEEHGKRSSSLLETPHEKKAYTKEVDKVKKLRTSALKKVKEKKVKELKKIKKKYKGSNLKKQLVNWKKQGYETGVLERKYELPDVQKIKNKLNKWKKRGYDISVLEKKLKK